VSEQLCKAMKLLGMSWRQWLCLAAFISHIRIESARIGLGSEDVLGSNRTEIEPITIASFAIGTVAALGSLYSFSKTVQQQRIRQAEKNYAKQLLRHYTGSLAKNCILIDRYYEYLSMRKKDLDSMDTMRHGLAEFCRVQNESLVDLPKAVNLRFAKECESANVSSAQALCRRYLENTLPETLADVCAISEESYQTELLRDLDMSLAELRGLRSGVCPNRTDADYHTWAAPELKKQNMKALLAYYPKCKHSLERAPSPYCWSSCSAPETVQAACSQISLHDVGLTATTFVGMHSEKRCKRLGFGVNKQRALCRATPEAASALQESSSPALQENSSLAVDPGLLINIFSLAYGLIGLVDIGADVVDTLARQLTGFQLLSDFLTASYREQRVESCTSAAKLWIHVASSHAIEFEIASWRYRHANLPELIEEIGENITSSTWAVLSGSDVNFEASSHWSCSKGCLTAHKAEQTQANASWISDLGSAISGVWSGVTANQPRKSIEDCKTSLGDWLVCNSGGQPFVTAAECFQASRSEGSPLLAFRKWSRTCRSPLMRIRNSKLELSKAREDLIEVCSIV